MLTLRNVKKEMVQKEIFLLKNFVKKMEQHNVVMCAITNHNKFDIEEFDNILSLEHNFILFPGIELDIQFSDTKHYHTILVCDPTEAKNLLFYF